MEVYHEHVLKHMNELWVNRRADLKRYNITKPRRSLRQGLDYVPNGLDKAEWEWLVKEIYSKDAHKVLYFYFFSVLESHVIFSWLANDNRVY